MNTLLNTLLFDDVPEHFPMGRQGGLIVPTVERISDTDSTPLGLTFRVEPATVNRSFGAGPTTTPTGSTSDGDDGEGTSDNPDSYPDQEW